MDYKEYDTIVIGGGPCGVAASIYIKQAGYNVAIIEKEIIGGAPRYTTTINNVAGFIGTGEEFANNLEQQVADNNIDVIYDEVKEIVYDNERYVFSKHNICSKTLVIATGSYPLKLEQLEGYPNVHYCALCDGPLYKGKDVVVIGGGNSAFTEAIHLSNICRSVTLLALEDYGFTAEQGLQGKARSTSNIKLDMYDALIANGENMTLRYWDSKHSYLLDEFIRTHNSVNDTVVKADAVFVSIGRKPNFVVYPARSSRYGYEVSESHRIEKKPHTRHIIPLSIFAGGDVVDKPIKQISTAISDGVEISKQVITYLRYYGG